MSQLDGNVAYLTCPQCNTMLQVSREHSCVGAETTEDAMTDLYFDGEEYRELGVLCDYLFYEKGR